MTVFLLIFTVWSFLEGRREAQYFHYKWSNPNPTKVRDEHLEFTIQRSLFVLTSTLTTCLLFGWFGLTNLFISLLTFSYIHNGSYYLRRNQLNKDIYKLGWFDDSETTTAKLSLNYKQRLVLFILGVLLTVLTDVTLILK